LGSKRRKALVIDIEHMHFGIRLGGALNRLEHGHRDVAGSRGTPAVRLVVRPRKATQAEREREREMRICFTLSSYVCMAWRVPHFIAHDTCRWWRVRLRHRSAALGIWGLWRLGERPRGLGV